MRDVIDTASFQRDLDLALPFADGFVDIYVKMGGDNVDTYEAPYYEQQVNAAAELGFVHIGHYWVPDGNPDDRDDVDTPTQQADYMLERLHGWDPATGFVVLDNENLDGAIRFDDAQAAEFVERIKAVRGIPGRQVFFYTNLSDARAHEWPLLLATGCVFIIAAPSYAPGEYPEIPTIPADRIVGHQYGTRTWGGVVTDVNVFHDDAFDYGGGNPVSLEQKAREFAARYPTSGSHPSGGDNDWDQDCGRVCYRFASSIGWSKRPNEGSVYSAYAVAMASGWLNPNSAAAPIGAWHFWDIGGAANGHVGTDLTGGGRRVFMGTWSVAEDWGRAIGVLSVSGYTAAKAGRARYLGWATNYAGGTVNLSGLAGLGTTPIDNSTPEPEKKDNDMRYLHSGANRASIGEFSFTAYTDATHGGSGWNTQYQAAASTLFDGIEVPEVMFAVARQDALNRRAAFLADIAAVANGIDPVVLKADVKAAVQEALDDPAVDDNGIDVAALVHAIVDEQAKRLGS